MKRLSHGESMDLFRAAITGLQLWLSKTFQVRRGVAQRYLARFTTGYVFTFLILVTGEKPVGWALLLIVPVVSHFILWRAAPASAEQIDLDFGESAGSDSGDTL